VKRPFRMTRAMFVIGAAFALAAPAALQAQDDPPPAEAEEMTKGERQLARLLEGRVRGEPVDCIRVFPNQSMRTIDRTAYVYGRGKTIYVQRTANPEDIDRRQALVTQRFRASELCRLDVVTTIDPILGFFTGTVFLEDFVPYTLVEDAEEG